MGPGTVSQPSEQIIGLTTPGLIVPTVVEARSLLENPPRTCEYFNLPHGVIGIISGVGPIRASRAAAALLGKGATALISWGCAGGLDPALSSGSLILPERIISSDNTTLPVDHAWLKRLLSYLRGHFEIHTGALFHSPTVLRSPAEKLEMFKNRKAIAVDMESGAVAEIAKQSNVPFLVIRAIADPAKMTILGNMESALDEKGHLRFFHLFLKMMRHPYELPGLIRLGRGFGKAQTTLCRLVRHAGYHFLAP